MIKKKEPLFHIVKRDALPWYQSVGIRAIAIVLALIVCAVVTMILTGTNPIQVFQSIIAGAFGSASKDMDHISEYCDPSVDLAGTDSGF